MVSFLQAIWRWWRKDKVQLACSSALWNAGVDELQRRARGEIESGAFLLGHFDKGIRRIEKFVFYDDIDPTCFLNTYGIVNFDGRNFGKLWSLCRELNMKVVADIHVHPGHYQQSPSDRQNPMIPQEGHMALILPDFATKGRLPGEIGIYEYQGERRWKDLSALGKQIVDIGG